jgi:hypothetical protein
MFDPRFSKESLLESKTLVAQLEDKEGDKCTYFIKVDLRIVPEGLDIEGFSFWPYDPDMVASVDDYITQYFS